MKKNITLFASVISIVNTHFSKEGKQKAAIDAVKKAEQAFIVETKAQITELETEKAILEQELKETELSFEPRKSDIMRAELQVAKKKAALEAAIVEAEEKLTIELANAAINGTANSSYFKQLVRVKSRDLTLKPLVVPATDLSDAESYLKHLQTNSKANKLKYEIGLIDERI